MVNEYDEMKDHNEDKAPDEGEYHFSDDEAHYNTEEVADVEKEEEATSIDASSKQNLLAHINNKKTIISIVVFIILLGLAYRFLVPQSNTPPTDFKKDVPQSVQNTVSTIPNKMQKLPSSNPLVSNAINNEQNLLVSGGKLPAELTRSSQNNDLLPQALKGAPNKSETLDMDKWNKLQQQAEALLSLLQTQVRQKNNEEQPFNPSTLNDINNKIQELTTRLSSLEVAFHQFTQIMRTIYKNPMNPVKSNLPPQTPVKPKIIYTVQAIIPGRAWLKSESGETVTVALGDTLKGYGRINKIDPYDGVVIIDTGNKLLTLSYGDGED